jgi:dienelactone hydrolase
VPQGSTRFEVESRGDRVPGRLWLGAGAAARPLVLVAPALGASKDAPEVEALCRALAGGGLAAAALDLALQGERASAKLSARLAACARSRERGGADRLLWDEFLRQTTHDLAAALAALTARREIDTRRLGCVAFEPGADAVAGWAEAEPRVLALRRVAAPPADAADLAAELRERLLGPDRES